MPLSNEDKTWIAELLSERLQTSKDETVTELKQHIAAEIKTSKDEAVTELKQHVEEVETRLLRAFRNYAHPVEARLRVQKMTSRAIAERIDALEDRIEFLEGGSTKPPTYTPGSP